MLDAVSTCDLILQSSPAMERGIARLEHEAIRIAVKDKKTRARLYALMPRYLGTLCRDLPGYAPERMIRCLDALREYRRSQPVKLLIGGDEVLANICGARLYARYSRYIEHTMRKRRAA